MEYSPPSGATSANASYVGKNIAAGQQGSKVPRGAVENPQREIVNAIRAAGLNPTNDDLTQLAQAIRALIGQAAPVTALWHSGVAAGTASAIQVPAVTPSLSSYADSLPVLVTMPFDNADGAMISVAGLASVPLLRNDGSTILRGDAPRGSKMLVAYDGAGSFRLVGFGRVEVPKFVNAPQLWIRPDGNDLNDGGANSPDRAFRTYTAAALSAMSRFAAASAIRLRLGIPGVYETSPAALTLSGRFTLEGDPNNRGGYVLAGAGPANTGVGVLNVSSGALSISGLTLRYTGNSDPTLSTSFGASVFLQDVAFEAPQGSLSSHLLAGPSSTITVDRGVDFAGNMGVLWNAFGGTVQLNRNSVGLIGSPAFSVALAYATALGQIQVVSGGSILGSASGRRYIVQQNSLINTAGGGENFFPGTVAGTKIDGGVYV